MKFVEFTTGAKGNPILVNADRVQMVIDHTIYFNLALSDSQDYVEVREDFERIKERLNLSQTDTY